MTNTPPDYNGGNGGRTMEIKESRKKFNIKLNLSDDIDNLMKKVIDSPSLNLRSLKEAIRTYISTGMSTVVDNLRMMTTSWNDDVLNGKQYIPQSHLDILNGRNAAADYLAQVLGIQPETENRTVVENAGIASQVKSILERFPSADLRKYGNDLNSTQRKLEQLYQGLTKLETARKNGSEITVEEIKPVEVKVSQKTSEELKPSESKPLSTNKSSRLFAKDEDYKSLDSGRASKLTSNGNILQLINNLLDYIEKSDDETLQILNTLIDQVYRTNLEFSIDSIFDRGRKLILQNPKYAKFVAVSNNSKRDIVEAHINHELSEENYQAIVENLQEVNPFVDYVNNLPDYYKGTLEDISGWGNEKLNKDFHITERKQAREELQHIKEFIKDVIKDRAKNKDDNDTHIE